MYGVIFVALKNDPGDEALLLHASRAAGGPPAPLATPRPTLIVAHAVHSHTRDATAFLRSDAETYLDEVAGPLRAQGFHVQTLVVEGEPAEAIRDAAAESGAELIVMGSHGHSQVRHFLLGSVTEAVIRGSEIPVLVVRPRPGEHAGT